MHLKRAFSAGGWPRWLAGSLGVLFFLGVVASVTAEPPERLRRDRAERSLTGAAHITRAATMDRNRVIMVLTQVGELGSAGSSVGGGGFWISEQNQYIFSSGPNLGALIPNGDGDGNAVDTAMYIGGPFSQVTHGSLEFAKLPNNTGLGHGNAATSGIFWDSTFEPDAENFPDPCTVDAFRINLFPSLQPFEGQPFPGFADQTICWAANDITQGICADCGGKRLGAESVQTAFAFGVPAVQDFVFVAFRMFNRSSFINAANSPSNPAGPYDFEETILSLAIDPDVGDATDDQITFFPDIGTMVYWDSNFSETAFIGTPGFGAISVFPVPDPQTGEAFSLEHFTVFTRDAGRDDPRSPQEWYRVISGDPDEVIFEVDPTDIRGQTSTNRFSIGPGEFVEIYAAYFFAPVAGSPPALLIAESPYQADNVTPRPGANADPAFDNIIRVQQTAQATFDAGFVVPTAPPKPDFNLIPGDNQVTVTWDASPVEFVNPFAKVALDPFARTSTGEPDPDAEGQGIFLEPGTVVYIPERDQGGTTGFVTAAEAGLAGAEVTNPAFNAAFVVQDFQGFRVYRSLTGLAGDAELIAQFDLNDAITGGVFCISAIPVFEGGEFVQNVCTEQAQLDIGENTGLGFAVIDRGGSFPNPGDGPGLINGIPVFYSVTSFSVNTGQSPVAIPPGTSVVPPAAPLVLESGLQPFKSATPRSDPSSLVNATIGDAALLDGDGNVVEPAGDIPITDSALTGPIPAARDWDINVSVVQPTEIPQDFELLFHIDSAPVSPGYAHANGGCSLVVNTAAECWWGIEGMFEEIPAGDGRSRAVWFSVTDGAGNLLETPTGPAVGSVLTGFISFTGVTNFTSPEVQILSPKDPDNGVALTLTYSSAIGQRGNSCPIQPPFCQLLTSDGSGVPASVADHAFSRGLYGQYRVADVEVTWSNQGGVLSLSSVRDISNNVEVPFHSGFGTEGWGFSKLTGLKATEDAYATDVTTPRAANGKVLFPDPYCSDFTGTLPGNCVGYGFITPFTQSEAAFTDLPVNPNVFDLFTPFANTYAALPYHQPGALQETAAFVDVDGQQGTRLYFSGHWLDLVFDQLPSDGETWLIRLPIDNVNGEPPRPPVPGMAIRVPITGGTSELANADLSAVRVVPNPFIAADELQRGRGLQRILFTNLPPQATIRIYTISGNLVRVLEHTDGDGTMEWDVRTRFDLLAASGNYYYHVTTPDGRTHLGRFAVVN